MAQRAAVPFPPPRRAEVIIKANKKCWPAHRYFSKPNCCVLRWQWTSRVQPKKGRKEKVKRRLGCDLAPV